MWEIVSGPSGLTEHRPRDDLQCNCVLPWHNSWTRLSGTCCYIQHNGWKPANYYDASSWAFAMVSYFLTFFFQLNAHIFIPGKCHSFHERLLFPQRGIHTMIKNQNPHHTEHQKVCILFNVNCITIPLFLYSIRKIHCDYLWFLPSSYPTAVLTAVQCKPGWAGISWVFISFISSISACWSQ